MKFVHRFSRSASCEMTVGVELPLKGERHIQEVEWTGRLKPKLQQRFVWIVKKDFQKWRDSRDLRD
ncbi:MAG TPA: hypothetical protein VFO40_02920 [Chthoniobacterales bacterium]|nr:hypothetical protein [Chthoniobacterales bacterium]